MNPKQKNSIFVSVLVIVACVAYVHLVLANNHRDLLTQKSQLQASINQKMARLTKIQELKTPLPLLEQNVNLLFAVGLPRGESIPDMIEQVEQLVLSQHDFSLVNFSPSLSTTKGASTQSGLVETPFTLVVKGDASKLDSVLGLLYSNIRPIGVKSIAVVADATEGAPPNSVVATLSLSAFSQLARSVVADATVPGATP